MNRYDVFIRIVETGSFTQAAAESGYTQSAVSQMIRTLEHELNTTLFLRSKTGAELTPDGREYLPYIQSVSNARRELEDRKSTRLNSSHSSISYAVFCLKKKKLYESYGFRQEALRRGYYRNPPEDAIIMWNRGI